MFRKSFMAVCLGLGLTALAPTASAVLIDTFTGDANNNRNDCAGEFGANFNECRIPEQYDPNQTPIIIKFEFDDNGNITDVEINSALFPSIDGNEFSFNFGGDGTGDGTWTYMPAADDPIINFFVAKGGPSFNLFSNLAPLNTDDWFTPTNPNNGQLFGLSHLSFYDEDSGGGGQIPEPAPLALLGAGLIAFALLRRRRGA
jgi:hypothetical protein